MPELPDLALYLHALESRVVHHPVRAVRVASSFVLRSVDPPIQALVGRTVVELRRMGKRIVFGFDESLFLVVHLMIAGRFRWKAPAAKIPKKVGLAALDFEVGTLLLIEAGTKKRASMHVVRGARALAAHDPGGLEPLDATAAQFRDALRHENRTLKRALTNPHTFSGIGNAYSDEILHAARLSPLKRTRQLTDDEVARLYEQTVAVLRHWIEHLRDETGDRFPEKVTAFRPDMAVHGRYRQPCPVCGDPVQRIVYADNECNYCATCQTGGKVLADRGMSRLLKGDWPRTIEAWEALGGPSPSD